MATYAKGTKVWLKSGGPQMTVNSGPLAGGMSSSVECVWFDKSGKRHADNFDQDALTDQDPAPPLAPMSSRS